MYGSFIIWRNMSFTKVTPEVERGRPRQLTARDAALAGTGELLLQANIKGFSIEGIDRLSGAGKPEDITIIRVARSETGQVRFTALPMLVAGPRVIPHSQRW
jgi:hypothetical protein